MLRTLEFENFPPIKKFSMAEGGEFRRINVLGGMPEDIDTLRCFIIEKTGVFARVPEEALEQGYHYSKYAERFLKVINTNIRWECMFLHTQSYEMLQAIVKALADDKKAQDNFAYVRLVRSGENKGHITAKSFTYERLCSNIKDEREVRGASYTYENLRDDLSINLEVR